MKSPPPLNLGSENLRVDASTNQAMGPIRANHNSAVIIFYNPVWSTQIGVNESYTPRTL